MENSANAARTITLGYDITLGEIDLKGTVGTSQTLFFGDAAEDNTLNFGGAATITTNDYYVTFRSGITGDLDLSAATDVIKVVQLGAPTLTDYTVVTSAKATAYKKATADRLE
jgi:hypothetical protein